MASHEKPRVFATFSMSGDLADILSELCDLRRCDSAYPTHAEILENVPGVHIIYCLGWTKITEDILDAAGPALKAICTHSAGYDHIDLVACKKRNIRIGYLGELVAKCTAEFTLGLMLATGRRFKEAMAVVSRGGWANRKTGEWLSGFQLMDSTVGIVGLGSMGFELAKRLKAFSVGKILYSGPSRKPEGDEMGLEYTEFEELLRQSDFVVACNDQTKGLFNARTFDLMKSSAIFVDVSRGEVVDQDALYDALVQRRIFASGLDLCVPEPLPSDHRLLSLDNCIVLPHLATMTYAMQERVVSAVVDNIMGAINDKPMACEMFI